MVLGREEGVFDRGTGKAWTRWSIDCATRHIVMRSIDARPITTPHDCPSTLRLLVAFESLPRTQFVAVLLSSNMPRLERCNHMS